MPLSVFLKRIFTNICKSIMGHTQFAVRKWIVWRGVMFCSLRPTVSVHACKKKMEISAHDMQSCLTNVKGLNISKE